MSIVNEKTTGFIGYAFKVDAQSPNFLAKAQKIFDVNLGSDVSVNSYETMLAEHQYSTSEDSADKKFAASMGVKGSYGAFSGAASMAVSDNTSSSIKTVRLDVLIKALQYEVSAVDEFASFPQERLSDVFKRSVEELSVEELEDRVGIFYATKMYLGGCVKKSYTMEATKNDTVNTVKAELEAKYGKDLLGVTVTGSTERSVETSSSNAKMSTHWSAQGGDTRIWLGHDFAKEDVSSVQKSWASSINQDNLFPFNFTLRPMWEMVKEMNPEKGEEFQKYLERKWEKDASLFNPKYFLKTAPMIHKHPENQWMLRRCDQHIKWCGEDATKAQGWINTFLHDTTRNHNWKRAAEEGVGIFNQIKEWIRDDNLTVSAFRSKLEKMKDDCNNAANQHWGLFGHDSEMSNATQQKHHDAIAEILNKV